MSSAEAVKNTPQKCVKKKGRPPKVKCKDDFCRICNLDFKVQLGNSKIATENLFTCKVPGREERKRLVLATMCQSLGLGVFKADHLTDRVCRPCARRIRNAKENLDFLKTNLENRRLEPVVIYPDKESTSQRHKRQLPTTVTPDRRVFHVKSPKSNNINSRKQLWTDECDKENITDFPSADDAIRNLMNIETLDDEQGRKKSQVRVIISYPNGEIKVKRGFDETATAIIRNIALKKWSAAANVIINHPEISCHVPDVMRRKVNSEFQKFGKDCMLKGTSLEELVSFNNNLFLHEIKVHCPFWFSAVNGVCGHTLQQSEKRRGGAVNAIALSTSVLAKQRNAALSAYSYRISVLLFHSGVKYQDIRRLNRLGLCMSPVSIVQLQKRIGFACDSKVLIWKKTIEEVLSALLFLRDIKKFQVPELKEDDMEIETIIDMSADTVKTYPSFMAPTYEFCLQVLKDAKNKRAETVINDTILNDAICLLQNKNLPHFR
jgi:hypothetical protein